MKQLASTWIMVLVGILCPVFAMAQSGNMVHGVVKDNENGDILIGASVFWEGNESGGVTSDKNGQFRLSNSSLPATLVVSFIGYERKYLKIQKGEMADNLVVLLDPVINGLEEVLIEGRSEELLVQAVDVGKNTVPVDALKAIPALFGEADVLRGLQLLPGIQTAGEGTTGLFVRGGSSDQNLIQLDGAPIYNPSHFFGFFSVFNPDALDEVELYKGSIPASLGGRISSVVDIGMKNGRTDHVHGQGGIGTISSKVTLDGPLFSEKSSFLVTGRRTYADAFLKLSSDEDIRSNQLYFYDLGAKATFRPSVQDELSISAYFGSDYLQVGDLFGLGWENMVTAANWDRSIGEKALLDVNGYYSRYSYLIDVMDDENGFEWSNLLSEAGLRGVLTLFPNEHAAFELGMHTRAYHFSPVEMRADPGSSVEPIDTNPGNALQQDIFLSGELDLSPRLKLEAGLRWSLFAQIGSGAEYLYADGEEVDEASLIDTVYYGRFEPMKFYQGKEPRAALRYTISESMSLKAAYNRNYQYLQVASNNAAGLPIDRWVLASQYIDPIKSNHYSAGLFKTFHENKWEVSVEGYYKNYHQLIDVRQGADILFTDHIETEVLEGKGWSYGAEFLVKKSVGKTTGWVGYTYSRTYRKIPGISEGMAYNPRYDRPHDASLVLQHEFSDRLVGNMTFVYSTGQAVSFPVGSYAMDNQVLPLYGAQRNLDRFPDYHRLDLAVTWKNKEKGKKWKGSWNFSIYNAYGRKNAYSYQFTDIINDDIRYSSSSGAPVYSNRPGVVMTYLFAFLPSISYNFEF